MINKDPKSTEKDGEEIKEASVTLAAAKAISMDPVVL